MDLLSWVLAEQLGQQSAHCARRRIILEFYSDFRTPAAARIAEGYGPGIRDFRSIKRTPSDQLVLHIVDNFRIPLHAAFTRPSHNPVRSGSAIQNADRFDVLHEFRQVLEIPP